MLSAEAVRKLEVELGRIKNVSFCSILLDSGRNVQSVDVVSDTFRAPQRIVRDVEIILRKHGVQIDHRKIGVVQMEQPERLAERVASTVPGAREIQEQAAKPAVLQLVPEAERIRLTAVHSTTRGGSFSVEVELTLGPYEGIPGRAEGPAGDVSSCVSLVAAATLQAVCNLLQPGYEARLKEARLLETGGITLVLTVVEFGKGREIQTVIGTCPQRGSLYDTAGYAVLDAINRPLGRANFRELAYLEDRSDEERGADRASA